MCSAAAKDFSQAGSSGNGGETVIMDLEQPGGTAGNGEAPPAVEAKQPTEVVVSDAPQAVPLASGENTYSVTVNVTFTLEQ